MIRTQISPTWNVLALDYINSKNRKRRPIDLVRFNITQCDGSGEKELWIMLRLSESDVDRFGLEGWKGWKEGRPISQFSSDNNVSFAF